MKKKYIFAIFSVLLITTSILAVNQIKNAMIGPTLGVQEVQRLWGNEVFNELKFKNGDTSGRAKMIANILKTKPFLGRPVSEVRARLGDYSGYFWNDAIPTYLINEGWKTDSDVWQLVFLPDHDYKVKDVIVNKNCCK